MKRVNFKPAPEFFEETSTEMKNSKCTEVPGGNSNPPANEDTYKRHRNWIYTKFEGEEKTDFRNCLQYHVYQLEKCPKTQKLHIQGYVQLKNAKSLGGMKRIDAKIHWEPRRGTHQQAKAYCMKEESRIDGPWQEGEEKDDQGGRTDLNELFTMIQERKSNEQIIEAQFGNFLRYHRGITLVQQTLLQNRQNPPEVWLIFGPSGAGKTYYVYEECNGDVYNVTDNKWWDGYQQQSGVLFDEAEINDRPKREWLQILDRYPYQVPIKGGFVKFNTPRIFIVNSSELKIMEFYRGDMRRRITGIIRFYEDGTHNKIIGNAGSNTDMFGRALIRRQLPPPPELPPLPVPEEPYSTNPPSLEEVSRRAYENFNKALKDIEEEKHK